MSATRATLATRASLAGVTVKATVVHTVTYFVVHLLRDALFARRRGWLVTRVVLLVVGVVNTSGPVTGSIEGLLYTTLPLQVHLRGLPEVLLQTFLLSVVLHHWVHHPEKRWMGWVLGAAFAVVLAMPALGLLAGGMR